MKFEISQNALNSISCDAVVVFLFENQHSKSFSLIDRDLGKILSDSVKLENFKGKVGNLLHVHTHGKILAPKVYILGLGKKEDFIANSLRKAFSLFAKSTKGKLNSVSVCLLDKDETKIDLNLQSQFLAEGILLGSYDFLKYKSKEDKNKTRELVIYSEPEKKYEQEIKNGTKIGEFYFEATKLARDLINESAAVVTPSTLATIAQDLSKKSSSINCEIYDKKEAKQMGMGAFLGVAQASDTPPKFIYLEYNPKNQKDKKTKLALIGKGITFDSGGINVKPGDSMMTMKSDMSGAASVLGIFSVIEQVKPDFCVMGLIAATPNMISGKSLVPGDVLRAMNGKTIEILNTDAEGRVIMADSLSFALKKGATHLIDFATLTGACMVALGTDITALYGNDKALTEKVKKAAEEAGEKVWEMPLEQDYKDLNKSEVADIANIPSTRYGGSITAALFLQEFVDNKPWIHLDIAGPAFAEKEYSYGPKGGTGFGVRTILNLLKNW